MKSSYNRIVREKQLSVYFPCSSSGSLNVIDKWLGQLVITMVFLWCDRRKASLLLQNVIHEGSNISPLELTLVWLSCRPQTQLSSSSDWLSPPSAPLLVLCISGFASVNRQYSYSLYWTGTSLQLRLTRGVFSDANAIYQMQQSCSPNLTSYPLTTASLVKFYYSVMY